MKTQRVEAYGAGPASRELPPSKRGERDMYKCDLARLQKASPRGTPQPTRARSRDTETEKTREDRETIRPAAESIRCLRVTWPGYGPGLPLLGLEQVPAYTLVGYRYSNASPCCASVSSVKE